MSCKQKGFSKFSGEVYDRSLETLDMPSYEVYTPQFVRTKNTNPPEVFPFREIILQSLLRRYLSNGSNLGNLFDILNLELNAKDFEVLGEKALPEGHVDILIKDKSPVGRSRKVVIEVKLSGVKKEDVVQLKKYKEELGEECVAAVMISEKIPKDADLELYFLRYGFDVSLKEPRSFEELLNSISIGQSF